MLDLEQGLLEFSAVQIPKLGLDNAKPVMHLQRINHLGERQRVHHQKVSVEGLHPWLTVGWEHLMLHEVLRQHPHELILRGHQLLDTHGWWRWLWRQWRCWHGGSPARSRGPSPHTGSRQLAKGEVTSMSAHQLPEITCTIRP
jgi:hypothetical protein